MQIPNSILKWVAVGLFVAILGLIVFGVIKKATYDSTIVALQNAVAEKDKTIETHTGIYEKLALESQNLKSLLDQQSTQVKLLQEDLKKRREELLVANNLTVYWKGKYEATGTGTGTTVPGPGGTERYKVEFAKDFGYIGVSGWTLTSPPEYSVSVQQNRPLALTLVVGQLPDGTWKASVVSSEENVGVDIKLSAVNPHIFDDHWYEKIGLSLDVGVSATGFLGGVGASYTLGSVDVGPKVFLTLGESGVNVSYGAGLVWKPFLNRR